MIFIFFFFNDTATTEIYTLSLHDALPISDRMMPASWFLTKDMAVFGFVVCRSSIFRPPGISRCTVARIASGRSEKHTSELQSRLHIVCRLLLVKKKQCARGTSQ